MIGLFFIFFVAGQNVGQKIRSSTTSGGGLQSSDVYQFAVGNTVLY